MTTNGTCQPQAKAMSGTTAGAMIAPTFAPELNRVVANARSLLGNQSATALMDDGKLPPSPRPSATRAIMNPPTVRDGGVADGREAPGGDRDGVADSRAEAIDEPAEEQQADGVRRLEGRVDLAELGVRPVQLVVEHRLEQREDLAVDVVDRRRQEQQPADEPAVAAGEGIEGGAKDARHDGGDLESYVAGRPQESSVCGPGARNCPVFRAQAASAPPELPRPGADTQWAGFQRNTRMR